MATKKHTDDELDEIRKQKQDIDDAPDATDRMGEELEAAQITAERQNQTPNPVSGAKPEAEPAQNPNTTPVIPAPESGVAVPPIPKPEEIYSKEEAGQIREANRLADEVVKQADDEIQAGIKQSVAEGEQDRAKLQEDIRESQIRDANKNYLGFLENQTKEWERQRKEQAARDAELSKNTAWGTGLSGIGEAISALANLTGVGAGAVNQQPTHYTQDWMRAADQDRRERQARLDNLEERQRAARENFMRAGLNIQLNNLQREETKAQRDKAEKLAAAKMAWEQYKLKVEQQGKAYDRAVRQAEAEGRINHQQAQDMIARYNAETNRLNAQSNAAYRNRMAGAAETRAAAYSAKASASSGGGKNKGNAYSVVIDGAPTTLRMSKDSYQQGIKSGTEELRQDIIDNAANDLQKAGVDIDTSSLSWEELMELRQQKRIIIEKDGKKVKVDNPLYGKDDDVIEALNNSGDSKADYDAIERYVKDNKSKVNNFNKHLQSIADESGDYEYEEDEDEATGNGELDHAEL